MSDNFQKGDWVRFYVSGRLVIGQVEHQHKSVIGTRYLSTDAGEVAADSVLECRRARREQEGT